MTNRLIVALDGPVDEAFSLVEKLRPHVGLFKVGTRMLLHPRGWSLVKHVGDLDAGLMLDLKAFDTPDTVAETIEMAETWLGPRFVTVHFHCVEAAMRAMGARGPAILAVGHLTSDPAALSARFLGPGFDAADGVICHPRRAAVARRDLYADKMSRVIVCPGVRPAGSIGHNHVDPCSPAEAIRSGADYLVVGRPIWRSANSVGAARAIVEEIEAASG